MFLKPRMGVLDDIDNLVIDNLVARNRHSLHREALKAGGRGAWVHRAGRVVDITSVNKPNSCGTQAI